MPTLVNFAFFATQAKLKGNDHMVLVQNEQDLYRNKAGAEEESGIIYLRLPCTLISTE